MSVEEKLEFFDLLCEVGFKQIEVGFPSAADTEFNFLRRLIDEDRIPPMSPCRCWCRRASTSSAAPSRPSPERSGPSSTSTIPPRPSSAVSPSATRPEQIRDIAIEGAKLVKELVPTIPQTEVVLQYSPESFSDTELDFALECCNAVISVWQPTPERKMIINLPDTVQWTTRTSTPT